MSKLPIEIRWMLAERRSERLYARSDSAGLSYGPRRVLLATDNRWAADKGAFVFHFGAYGCTHVLAYGCLEDALEDAAAVLKEHAPGMLCEPDYEDARKDLAAELIGLSAEDADTMVAEYAESDLTYTESGWIPSHEWMITELHSPDELLTFVRNA